MEIVSLAFIWLVLGILVWGHLNWWEYNETGSLMTSDMEGILVLVGMSILAPMMFPITIFRCIKRGHAFNIMYTVREDAEWTDVAWKHVARHKGKQVVSAIQWVKCHTVGRKRATRS